MAKEHASRLLSLEGLRAVAAIVVVLFHSIIIFYPAAFYGTKIGYTTVQNSRFEDNIYGNPLSFLLSGTFAVSIFFVLSGFVLTVAYFSSGKEEIINKMAAKRYLRLMLPALASIMVAWVLLRTNLSHAKVQVASITHSLWLQNLWPMTSNFFTAIGQGVWGVFNLGDVNYNPVLWTIRYEFIGSFMVFTTALITARLRQRWIIYVFLCVALFNSWLIGFVLGMVLADAYSRGLFPFNIKDKRNYYLLLIIGLFFGAYPASNDASHFYQTMALPFLSAEQNQALYTAIGAMLVIICILASERLTRVFSHRFLSYLGKYTYSLYLVHLPLLLTICTSLFLLFYVNLHLSFHISALISAVSTYPVIALITYLFQRYVDAPSIHVSGVFAKWLRKS